MKKPKDFFIGIGASLKRALFPENITCNLCSEDLHEDSRYGLCEKCLEELPFIDGHFCAVCGVPLDAEEQYCLRCQNLEAYYMLNRSPLLYDGKTRELIHQLKFAKRKYIAKTLGAMMADVYIRENIPADFAVYVPMTESEEKKRGFNQSELIAVDVTNRLNMPLLPALRKIKDTSQQKELGRADRAKNLEGAFVCGFEQVKGRNILLVDDIFTTGATSNECAKTLLKAGAKKVYVLTAAITKPKIPVEVE